MRSLIKSWLESDAWRGERVLSSVHELLGRFVAYPSEYARVARTLWIAYTHLMHLWENTPRIAFLSPEPASEKTRALEISERMVPRATEAVNISPSALFRSVSNSDGLPTILFDEIETIFGPRAKDNEDIRGLLNAGHRRGAKTYRSVLRRGNPELEAMARPEYAKLTSDIKNIKAVDALMKWGKDNANRVETMPLDWQEILHGEFRYQMLNLVWKSKKRRNDRL
jgi:hypothetical protein